MMNRLLLGLLPILLSVPAAQASNIDDLNRRLPLEMEDARTTEAGSIEPQLVLEHQRTRDGRDQYWLIPQIQYGYSPQAHLQLSTQAKVGEADHAGNWNLQAGTLFHFLGTKETTQAGIYAEVELPTGFESAGIDTEVVAIVTQPVRGGEAAFHLNVSWIHNGAIGDEEREHGYRAVLGAHQKLNDRWILLADLVRLVPKEKSDDANLAEIGIATEIGDSVTAGLGFTAGLGDSTPRSQVTLAVQYSH